MPGNLDTLPPPIPGSTTYHFKRKIATGGMGSVYEVEQHGVEGFVKAIAIKTILSKYTENEEFVEMFIGEAKLVADLVHQNIVQIYQLGIHDGVYYIAMEFIDGITLEQFMDVHDDLGRPVPVDVATFIVSRICRGLEYAHSKRDDDGELLGIVHRDVSPKNIMIANDGEVKLTDFGVAKAERYMHQKEDEVLMGKVEYMSPEQASYLPTDARSDLFSLCVVYYELLTGENIFACDDVFDTLDRVRNAPIEDPREYRPDLPDDVVGILNKGLNRDPDKRWQTAGELGYALEYQMYNKGYGPTIVSLGRHVAELYPERRFFAPPSAVVSDTVTKSDTQFYSGPRRKRSESTP